MAFDISSLLRFLQTPQGLEQAATKAATAMPAPGPNSPLMQLIHGVAPQGQGQPRDALGAAIAGNLPGGIPPVPGLPRPGTPEATLRRGIEKGVQGTALAPGYFPIERAAVPTASTTPDLGQFASLAKMSQGQQKAPPRPTLRPGTGPQVQLQPHLPQIQQQPFSLGALLANLQRG